MASGTPPEMYVVKRFQLNWHSFCVFHVKTRQTEMMDVKRFGGEHGTHEEQHLQHCHTCPHLCGSAVASNNSSREEHEKATNRGQEREESRPERVHSVSPCTQAVPLL